MVLSPADVANSQDKYDILIIDESHRLRQRYGLASPGDYKAFDHKNEILGLGKKGTELDWILKRANINFSSMIQDNPSNQQMLILKDFSSTSK